MSWSYSTLRLIHLNRTSLPPWNFRSAAWACTCCEVFEPPTRLLTSGLRYALVTCNGPKASLAGCKTFSASERRFPSKCFGKALGRPVFVWVSSASEKFFVIALDLRRVSCSSCSPCCCLHSLNACLASCSCWRGYLSLVVFSSFGSLRKRRANAPTIKVLTSLRLARSKKTNKKQRLIRISPSNVVFGLRKRRSISILLL